MKVLILGNSGSGKSWLGRKLASSLGIDHIEMDRIFWEAGGCNSKRDKKEVSKELSLIADKDNWIVEGVFGEIADHIIESATHLVWLDFKWDYCLENLNKRGPQFEKGSDRALLQKSFDELIDWASKYDTRQSRASWWYHDQLYQSFNGVKYHIHDPSSLVGLISGI